VINEPERPKAESKRSSRRRRDERADVSGDAAARDTGDETTVDARASHVDKSHLDQVAQADPDTDAVTTADTGKGTDDQSPAAPPRSLLDPVRDFDDLPEAVTPRKRTRKRVTRPAGQPTPSG
jgi:hypothetical protein